MLVHNMLSILSIFTYVYANELKIDYVQKQILDKKTVFIRNHLMIHL